MATDCACVISWERTIAQLDDMAMSNTLICALQDTGHTNLQCVVLLYLAICAVCKMLAHK
jgi:hypothetical protein